MCDENKEYFNVQLSHVLEEDCSFEDFNEALMNVAKDTLTENTTEDKVWFHLSKDTLKPILDKRSEFLHHIRQLPYVSEEITKKCRDLKNDVKDAVSAANIKWTE